jgi:hypothetical protein
MAKGEALSELQASVRQENDGKYFCYLYKDQKTKKVLYVGYATFADRALTPGHNEDVLKLSQGERPFDILIAGPYTSEQEARNVEAALVSAISPELNRIEQPGIKFQPLGMPANLAGRRPLPALDIHEIGKLTGGAIVVYCNLTSGLKSGKQKLTLTNFGDDVVFDNIQEYWYVRKYLQSWIDNPHSSPKMLVAVQGPYEDRVIVGAAKINESEWSSAPVAEWDKSVHRIPIERNAGLDCAELRGRRVQLKFFTGKANYIMIVDGDGLVVHGFKMKGSTGKNS